MWKFPCLWKIRAGIYLLNKQVISSNEKILQCFIFDGVIFLLVLRDKQIRVTADEWFYYRLHWDWLLQFRLTQHNYEWASLFRNPAQLHEQYESHWAFAEWLLWLCNLREKFWVRRQKIFCHPRKTSGYLLRMRIKLNLSRDCIIRAKFPSYRSKNLCSIPLC